MSPTSNASLSNGRHFDARLMLAVDEIGERIQRGESIDIEAYATEFPDRVDYLRQLVRTLEGVAALGKCERDTSEELVPKQFQQIGDFRIVRELGRGGMGTVYEAEQLSMGRRVALKVLPFAALAQDKALQRFRNEVRAAAALDHPHIVSVYSVGEERGIHYYAMQLIRGQTLANVIWQLRNELKPSPDHNAVDRGDDAGRVETVDAPISTTKRGDQAHRSTAVDSRQGMKRFRKAAELGIQAAQALQYAHDQGVLHRDIKPGNLLLDAEDNLYVTDFGLARIGADAGLTMSGDILGTLRYMPPEQAMAKRMVIDQRADIYSLGATLYELLALEPAFAASERDELLKQIAFNEPVCLRKLDRQIPSELETIVGKAMEKSPDDRYATAQAMADDLRAVLENRPIKAKPPTLLNRAAKWSRRNVAVVWMMVAMLLAVSIVLLISQLLIGRVNRELAAAVGREQAAAEKSEAAERQSGDLLFAADVRLAGEALANNNVNEARERLARHIPHDGSLDRRNFAWHYLWNQLQQEEMTLTGHGWAFDVEYSPDGSVLASSHESGEVVLYRAETGEELRVLADLNDVVRKIDFSPDGTLLAGISDLGQVCVWRVEDGSVVTQWTAHDSGPGSLAFHPDGVQLVTATNLEVKVHRLPSGDERGDIASAPQTVATLGPAPGTVYTIDISPDGRWLAAGGADVRTPTQGCFRVWNLATAKIHYERRFVDRVDSISFTGTESTIAIANSQGRLALWEVGHDKETRGWMAHPNSRSYDLVYAKRDRLISAAKDSTVRVWNSNNGALLRVIQGHSERVCGVAVRTATGQIATASKDETVKIWHPLGKSFSKRHLREKDDSIVHHARFAPDSKSLVETLLGNDSNVVRHDLAQATHKKWRVFDLAPGYVAWAQDAEKIVLSGKNVVATDEVIDGGAGVDRDCALVVYNARSMRIENRIQAFSGEATHAAISPNGRHLAVVESDHTIRLWELPGGQLVHTVPAQGFAIWDIVYSPDGRFLLAAVGDDLKIWNSQDFVLKHHFQQHDDTIARVVVSDDSRLAATVSHDKSVRLWSLNEGRLLHTLIGHTTLPTAAAFSRDGRCLATGADGGIVHVWDVVTGQQLIVLRDAVGKASYKVKDLIFRDEGTLAAAVNDEEELSGPFLAEWRANSRTSVAE